MAFTKFYKIITPQSADAEITDNQDIAGNRGLYGNYTWYHKLIHGSAHRTVRYREYDMMDNDVDVARALDIIAEEIAGNNPKSEMPMEIKITADNEQEVASRQVVTLNAALKTWCRIQDWQRKMFYISRSLIKYGDVFFFRPKESHKKWIYLHPKNVIGAIVANDDVTDVRGWQIKMDSKTTDPHLGTNLSVNVNAQFNDYNVQPFKKDEIIRFTLNDDTSDEAPFGESILRAVYRTFKQKELLEDAILIYRIQRAPERRVFYIDVGKMPANQVQAHLEKVKTEFRQKKIPSFGGGKDQVDSVYNPQSMNEDFFFARRPDGGGGSVETLPAGQNLGELQDLQYFYQKMWRGLRIPQSYMDNTTEGGGSFNDGKVGIAYMQEIKFTLYIERLQRYMEVVLDREFKKYIRDLGLNIDPTIYQVVLPAPSNYKKSRNQAIDSDLLNTYGSADGIQHLSKRFALKKYLQLTQDEILTNERMLREEKGLPIDGGKEDLPKIYFPEDAEAGGFEGGLGGGFGGGGGGSLGGGPDTDLDSPEGGDDVGADPLAATSPTGPTPATATGAGAGTPPAGGAGAGTPPATGGTPPAP